MKNIYKKGVVKISVFMTLLFIATMLFTGCENDTTPSLYDPAKPKGSTPEITSLSPAGSALAGVSEITITGNNFSTVKEENIVYFNGSIATVLDAKPTQLVVKAPNLILDDISVKVAVYKVSDFSNTVKYNLKAAVEQVFDFKDFEVPNGLTTDEQGNIYMSFTFQGGTGGTKKLTPTGTLTEWAQRGSETFHTALKWRNGKIYAARRQKVLFEITAGAKPVTYVSSNTALGNIYDFDFDPDGNIWSGGDNTGNNAGVYRIKSADKSIKTFAFDGNIKSIRIFKENNVNLYVYVAATKDNEEAIFRAKIISADSLTAFEKVFSLTEKYGTDFPAVSALAVTFALDGDMIIGTNMTDPVVVVHPNGNYETLYPGLLGPNALLFAWGPDNNLYYTREKVGTKAQVVLRVDMQKPGAPYYGRN
ncbi:MAG TPA: IPT/TIG domain-containing protein [Melioribacteraceae bacterium]|nr:IPT/TIG domain-containing protein [Melioribacteraceae bacterium]